MIGNTLQDGPFPACGGAPVRFLPVRAVTLSLYVGLSVGYLLFHGFQFSIGRSYGFLDDRSFLVSSSSVGFQQRLQNGSI